VKKLIYLLIVLVTFSFKLSERKNDSQIVYDPKNVDLFGHRHKEFYPTGEIKFICHDTYLKCGGIPGTTGMTRRYRFRRLYFDRCGNIKLIVKGMTESGCWIHDVKILVEKRKNEEISCDKEVFVYPTLQNLKDD
jgi:hypothetical protein